jgi:glucokinase
MVSFCLNNLQDCSNIKLKNTKLRMQINKSYYLLCNFDGNEMKKEFIISIDMGGTKVLAALIDSESKIIYRLKKATKIKEGKADYSKTLSQMIFEILRKKKVKETQVKAVCLGVPGSVNPHSGIIGMAPNLNIKNYNIKEALQKFTKIPVFIENDVNLAALGIKNFELSKEIKNVLVVFVGTGIGGGLIFENKIYRGSSFFAGEIGHIIVDPKGPLCGCGNKGCFEALASRTAITKEIAKEVRAGKKSILSKFVRTKIQIKSKSLLNAVNKNDKVTIRCISKACKLIGSTLANINNLLNLDMIVLGGGVIESLEKFMLPQIKAAFKENSLSVTKNVKLTATKLGDDAALYGGVALANEFLSMKTI